MENYSQALKKEEWAELYNVKQLENIVFGIKTGDVSIWTKEMEAITEYNVSVLEIGAGSGLSSLWLAGQGRKVTALDYTEEAIALINESANRIGGATKENINTVVFDATKELPFPSKHFDFAFQAGLLEHFTREEQIELLGMWKNCCRKMISFVPNKASIPYRVGKKIQEENGTWSYGREIPKHSMIYEFEAAGIHVIDEYTIGTEWALKFLPARHYLRKLFAKMRKEGINLDDIMQGYLLVTIGEC